MTDIPDDLKYTNDHEWIRMTDEFTGECGITDHAQEMLTDIVFVELPDVDMEVSQGDQVAVVESVKAVSDVYSPVSGRIIEVNTELEENPELINESPYENGWIYRIDVKDKNEYDNLMDADAYTEYVEKEG